MVITGCASAVMRGDGDGSSVGDIRANAGSRHGVISPQAKHPRRGGYDVLISVGKPLIPREASIADSIADSKHPPLNRVLVQSPTT
jgi:hypothetical protein